MKTIACKDIHPGTSCTYIAKGFSVKEVVNKMIDHSRADHLNYIKDINDDEIRKKIEAKMEDH